MQVLYQLSYTPKRSTDVSSWVSGLIFPPHVLLSTDCAIWTS